jgi:uncharacterized protein (TIGR03067 family)
MKARAVIVIGVVALLVAADAPRDDGKKEADRLQGTWKAVAVEENGKAVTGDVSRDCRLVVTGDKAVMKTRVDDQFKDVTYQLKLDPASEPKGIDLIPVSDAGPVQAVRGVYQLDKDVLKIRLGKPGEKRAPGFALKTDADTTLFILQRVSP